MLDPVKTALATLGTAFAAGAAWVTIKSRVAKVEHDLNQMGRSRVKGTENSVLELRALLDEQRQEFGEYRERALRREMHLRERLARLEERAGIQAVPDFEEL